MPYWLYKDNVITMSKIFTYTRQGVTRTMFLDVTGRVNREIDGTPAWLSAASLLSSDVCQDQPRVEALKQKTLKALTQVAGGAEKLQRILKVADAYYAMLPSIIEVEQVSLPEGADENLKRAGELRRRFLDPEEPCFFPSCVRLRTELKSAIDAHGEDCPDCTKNQLEQQFAAKAVEAFLLETSKP